MSKKQLIEKICVVCMTIATKNFKSKKKLCGNSKCALQKCFTSVGGATRPEIKEECLDFEQFMGARTAATANRIKGSLVFLELEIGEVGNWLEVNNEDCYG